MDTTIIPPCEHGRTARCSDCDEVYERHDTVPAPPPSMSEFKGNVFLSPIEGETHG